MTAYLDSSALLRVVLQEPGALETLADFDALVSSELLAVECRRTIDRLRLQGRLTLQEAAAALEQVVAWLEAVDLVLVRSSVLTRAGDPMPVALGTLDAMHLATALILRDQRGPLDVLLTHDEDLGRAARAFGFDVRGA